MNKFNFHGIQLVSYDYDLIRQRIFSSSLVSDVNIIFASGATLVRACKDNRHFEILKNSLVVCDSKIVWRVIKFWDKNFEYCRGVDFFRRLLSDSANHANNIVFGGSKLDSNSTAESLKSIKSQSVSLSYIQLPHSESIDHLASEIRKTLDTERLSILWLCIGSPKQDFVSIRLRGDFRGACISIGAALNFVTGAEREAPKHWQRLYLEWAYRLIHNPRRLWRRYLIGNIELLILILSFAIRNKKWTIDP